MILVTCRSRKEADRISALLLREKLVACATVVGSVSSRFRWKGRITAARETPLMVKTTAARFEAVARRVKSAHSYEVPEIIALPIAAGDKTYLQWVRDSVE